MAHQRQRSFLRLGSSSKNRTVGNKKATDDGAFERAARFAEQAAPLALRAARSARLGLLLALLAAAPALHAQPAGAPRLAVVIVVDQMRADYLVRFRRHFAARGFNLFLAHGAWLTQARYAHIATVTCAGHATVLTGSPPAVTGIVANEWWNAQEGHKEYCARDDTAPLIGVDGEGRSPKNLIGSTVGDMLKLSNGGRSRVISVAGKDRAAIMLGGHLADAAYWLEGARFVTSTYYRDDLPGWATRFNASGVATRIFGKTWDRLLPPEAYATLGRDDDPAERDKPGLGRAFPHVIGAGLADGDQAIVEAFEYSPFHNDVVAEFAMEAVRNERLGKGPATDLLALGLSANDRIGHAFGPDSSEVLDVTVRTDRLLERFFAFLDDEVGLENTTIVLTADHGVAPLPEAVNRLNPHAGARRMSPATIREAAESALTRRWSRRDGGGPWVVFHDAPYLRLDERQLASQGIDLATAELTVKGALEQTPGVFAAYTSSELRRLRDAGAASDVLLSFFLGRSGNVLYIKDPFVIEEEEPGGTGHGSPWSYDRRVPILWYGAGIEPGVRHTEAYVRDIAPTLSQILGVEPPVAAAGRVLTEVLR